MSSLDDISRDNGAFSMVKAQAHITQLRMFVAVYDAMGAQSRGDIRAGTPHDPELYEQLTHRYLLVSHWRYRWYLDVLCSLKDTPKDNWPVPPWDVALMMHTHLLHPASFAQDISSSIRYNALAGRIDYPLMKLDYALRHPENQDHSPDAIKWHQVHPINRPYRMMEFSDRKGDTFPPQMNVRTHYHPMFYKLAARPPPFSIDLREAVKRQIGFARKITSMYPYDPVPDTMLLDSQQRYAKFMNLIRMNGNPAIVPAVDIDLFWHTHQLSGSTYIPWCKHHIGYVINHDDTVGEGDLSTGLDDTVQAWEAAYSEDYLNPSPGPVSENFPSTPREPSILDRTPPLGLTPAQLYLWNFDVAHQIQHEQAAALIRTTQAQFQSYTAKIAALPPAPSMSSSPAKGGGGSFMKRLLKVAVAAAEDGIASSSRSSLTTNQNSTAHSMKEEIEYHNYDRQEWGRQRWPLLVAARGWGDPTVTNGYFVRPPQGTASLDFPIYAATWYDNKELGYYNYISGGRDGGGAIEGGGIRVGGAMCAGRFNGGNCIAAVHYSRYSESDNAGGGG